MTQGILCRYVLCYEYVLWVESGAIGASWVMERRCVEEGRLVKRLFKFA